MTPPPASASATWQAEAHIRSLMFREKTRWPGCYYRADFPEMDEANWKVFANSCFDPASGEWETMKKDIIKIVD